MKHERKRGSYHSRLKYHNVPLDWVSHPKIKPLHSLNWKKYLYIKRFYNDQLPGANQLPGFCSPDERAATTGERNLSTAAATSLNEAGTWSCPSFLQNAVHWICFESMNVSVKASIFVGSAVLRRSKVNRMASANFTPSKSNWRDKSHMSKKSFIRLLSMPSLTIASNFSAIALSRL